MVVGTRGRVRRTISRDLMLSLSFITSVMVIFFGMSYSLYFTKVSMNDLHSRASRVAEEISRVMVNPVWNFDFITIHNVGDAYLGEGFVTGMRIYSLQEVVYEKIPDKPDNMFVRQKDIIRGHEKIGTVSLYFTSRDVIAGRNALIKVVVLIAGAVLAAVVLSIRFFMKRLFKNPFEHLLSGVRAIAGGDYECRLTFVPQEDLNAFINEINLMAARISERETDLKRLNENLKLRIAKQKRTEKELLESRERYSELVIYLRNIVDSMPSVLVGVDREGLVTQWNNKAESVTGIQRETAYGEPAYRIFPFLEESREIILRAISRQSVTKKGKVAQVEGGRTRYSDVMVYPLKANGISGAVIRIDDVTERVRLEEMMIQSEKMLSVGGLAAGMAHEINNPLAGILQNVQVMKNRIAVNLPKNRKIAEECGTTIDAVARYMEKRDIPGMVDAIMESGGRAAKIVENMLSFSRRSEHISALHDLGELMDKTVELAVNDYDLSKKYDFKKIEIVREYDKTVPAVPCEATKIQQVFLNILKNGAQAMAERGISGDTPRFILRVMKKSGMARIEIEDNGPGMDECVRKRIFEPFFTTKEVGVGTGLGLSVSYFIIAENHGGMMSVESALGRGSKFIITLPFMK